MRADILSSADDDNCSEHEAYRRYRHDLDALAKKNAAGLDEKRRREERGQLREGWVLFFALVALVAWQRWLGAGIWLMGVFAISFYQYSREQWTRGANQDGVELILESYVRYSILADLQKGGEVCWDVENGQVVAADHPLWETFWTRVHALHNEFYEASPRDRRKRLAVVQKQSLAAQHAMMRYAEEQNAKPCWWAIPRQTGLMM